MGRGYINVIFLIFILAIVLIMIAGIESNSNIIFTFLLLLISGIGLCINNTAKLIFTLSLSINSIFSIVFYYYFIHVQGAPFIGGGDDEFFYKFILSTFKTGFTFGGLSIIFYRFWFFIFIYYHFAAFLNSLGIWDENVLHLIFLNCFFGALINVMVYHISKNVFNLNVALKAALTCTIFPYLIFNYATLLRETLVIFLLFLSLTLIVVKSPIKIISSMISLGLGVLSSIGIRLETGFVNIFVVLGAWFKGKISMKILSALLLAGALVYFGPLLYEKRYKGQDEFYNDNLQSIISQQSGLGAKLATYKDHPLGMGAYTFLAVYAPVPPIQEFNRLDNIFNGIGAIFWYFMIPIAILGFYRYDHDKRFKLMSLIILLSFFFISYKMQAAVRHRVPLMPIVIMFYCYGLSVLNRRTISMSNVTTSTFLSLGLLFYLLLKILL